MIVECPGCKRRYDVSGRPPGTRARCRCGTSFTLPEPPATANVMGCPQCGASVPVTSTVCEYCRGQLAVRACPRCFGKLFLGTSFCPGCGARCEEPATALPDGSAAPRHCPRCQGGGVVRLESRLVSDLMLDTCPECDGVFLDSDLLERVLAERRFDADDPHSAQPVASSPPRGAPGGPVYIRCPDCEKPMARRLFAPRSGVIVDVCRHHGTWLDADELERLIAFVQQGGLDQGAPVASFDDTVLRKPSVASTTTRTTGPSMSAYVPHEPRFFEHAVGAIRALLR